jgi:eukaryotic-like serine/threonine-protein kinase
MMHPRMFEADVQRSISAANAAGIFAEGSRFGSYVIGPCIGHGETGRIYRAEHEAINSPLALKVFTDEFARSAMGRNRFLRQARQAATIRHPSVVNIFDVGVQSGIPYLVMELLDGEDLDALLHSRGALDEGAIVDLMIPIVAGLSALHEVGLVHGDLKSKSVFLVYRSPREREPKLLDFGVARTGAEKLRRASGTRGIFRGSALYIAPEVARGEEATALSDQYSLGVVLYECAVGVNPFATSSGADALRRVMHGDYPPLSHHEARPSEALVRIVERAMGLDAASRYPDLKALGRDLLMLSGERTRMTWSLSFGEARGAPPARRQPFSPLGVVWRAGDRLRASRLADFDWGSAAAIAFGIVTFAWGIAILLSR